MDTGHLDELSTAIEGVLERFDKLVDKGVIRYDVSERVTLTDGGFPASPSITMWELE
jgi:hypothetical protein